MKYIITTFLLILSYDASAQITLDSFKVYQTGPTLDSIYFRATSYNGQVLSKISATPSNDACGTVFGAIFFTGATAHSLLRTILQLSIIFLPLEGVT